MLQDMGVGSLGARPEMRAKVMKKSIRASGSKDLLLKEAPELQAEGDPVRSSLKFIVSYFEVSSEFNLKKNYVHLRAGAKLAIILSFPELSCKPLRPR